MNIQHSPDPYREATKRKQMADPTLRGLAYDALPNILAHSNPVMGEKIRSEHAESIASRRVEELCSCCAGRLSPGKVAPNMTCAHIGTAPTAEEIFALGIAAYRQASLHRDPK